MRIPVEAIPDEGLPIAADLGSAWVAKAAEETLGVPPEAASLDVSITRLATYLRVKGKGQVRAVLPCDRCGEPVRVSLQGPIDLYYSPSSDAEGGDIELTRDELDIGWFNGEALELGDVLAEQVALWMPPRVRCGDRGIEQVGEPHPCAIPDSDPGPELRPASPFAKLRLPE